MLYYRMTQTERQQFLIQALLDENPAYKDIAIPAADSDQKRLLRSLVNVRPASPASSDFLRVQDEYLLEENKRRGITTIEDIARKQGDLYLWQGDITTLRVDAIVNAANSGMTGCYEPCHACIDNCIHTFSGIQLRAACAHIMQKQGHEEPTGSAKITPAFNLPCTYILHTVGPIIRGAVTEEDCALLSSCYTSCLDLSAQYNVGSIAFCCISTGVFHFPAEKAARIAVSTVQDWKARTKNPIKVIFNVFNQKDYHIYDTLLS